MESGLPLSGGELLPITNIDLTARKAGDDPGAGGRYVRLEYFGEPLAEVQLNPIVGFVMNHEIEVHGSADVEEEFILKEGNQAEILEIEVDPNFLVSHAWLKRNVGFCLETPVIIKLSKVTPEPWGLAGEWRLAEPGMCEWYTVWPTDASIRVSLIGGLAEERREFLLAAFAKIGFEVSEEDLLDLLN